MNRISKVCLAILAIGGLALAQTSAKPPLQKGISVDMALTHDAAAAPDADAPLAWIVTITAEGKFYFGLDPVTPEKLAEDMKTHPRDRDAKLYVKADARARFLDVQKVFAIAREVYFEQVVLLTAQPAAARPAGPVAPWGIPVSLGAAPKQPAVALQVAKSSRADLVILINNQPVKESILRSTLDPLLRDKTDKTLVLKVSGPLAFAQIAQVLDMCSGAGANIVIPVS